MKNRRAFLQSELDQQRRWIAEHGGDLAGYVERYGAKSDPEHYGDGGEAIFAADSNHLRNLEEQFAALPPGPGSTRFQVLMLFRASLEIEAGNHAEAERLAALLTPTRPGAAFPLSLKDGIAPARLLAAEIDDVEVVDVEEAS